MKIGGFYYSRAYNEKGMDGGPALWLSNFYAVGIVNSFYNPYGYQYGTYTVITQSLVNLINSLQ